ncbi:MAG: DNA mismatch repair protein MutS [Lachnospiraceae bacterium]|nr:DNA mismatch repair protein MutS [Lachnospiraceae bacterium]MDY2956479.1 DNA mismatch repair protein MutS [Lachnospiraceae bacterium]
MLSPMMQHYVDTKEKYKDCILFYRLGDFYEMFFDDALIVSKELELTLTGRDCGLEERAPMCGVPYHSAESYISRLVKNGHKVAVCEQLEDPKKTKDIVKRDVIKIITPGTLDDTAVLDEGKNNYLMCIAYLGDKFGISYIDYTTGEFFVTEVKEVSVLMDEINRIVPAELVTNEYFLMSGADIRELSIKLNIAVSTLDNSYFDRELSYESIKKHTGRDRNDSLLKSLSIGIISAGAILGYIDETQKIASKHILEIIPYDPKQYMIIDSSTCRNLELVETINDKSRRGSLLGILDKSNTAMGKRLLRSMIEQPLCSVRGINERLDAVESFVKNPIDREELREYLSQVYDIERLLGKICTGSAMPKDLVSFKKSLSIIPAIKQVIAGYNDVLITECFNNLYDCSDIESLIDNAIVDDPPLVIRDGGIIKDGFSHEIDEYRSAKTNGTEWLNRLEDEEREKTGIKNLRIRFNKVFGYYLEVTNSYKDKVPEDWIRKQTLTNAERYITPELKRLEDMILGAQEKMSNIEYETFVEVREKIAGEAERLRKISYGIARLDVYTGLAKVSSQNSYVRPRINASGDLVIRNGRHPVIENMVPENTFVANDTELNNSNERIALITGPNMSGKSTYMRQTALITLMAHMGCFVPASSANICIVDRIFTRVGASDDLSSGKSTFMVEMSEVATILNNATKKSLLILDEIGRGTGTLDGLSIARAVVEYIADEKRCGAKTLFATHYHELVELEEEIPCLKNLSIAVKENGDDIVFLRKIVSGGADKSYGIHVAKLAGVPKNVIERAKILLAEYSKDERFVYTRDRSTEYGDKARTQLSFFDNDGDRTECSENTDSYGVSEEYQNFIEDIKSIDINHLTPLDALKKLMDLQESAKELI